MKHIVGISDLKITDSKDDVLVTYSLGSCVGLALYDPAVCVGALIHCMLPLSRIDVEKAEANPFMFVDTGLPQMLDAIYKMGARRDNLVAKVAGASNVLDAKRLFKIGERNYTVLRKILWKNNILIASEDVGGTKSRTLSLYMSTGRVTVKSGSKEVDL